MSFLLAGSLHSGHLFKELTLNWEGVRQAFWPMVLSWGFLCFCVFLTDVKTPGPQGLQPRGGVEPARVSKNTSFAHPCLKCVWGGVCVETHSSFHAVSTAPHHYTPESNVIVLEPG